ncbi:hypothetical protein ACC733_39085, partial [Rhizobium johnstonii]|uniref:hypothetical protein n=1 Tax=Rhizobium johnstonii TaxID=3019933 RepID=UPI003F99456B
FFIAIIQECAFRREAAAQLFIVASGIFAMRLGQVLTLEAVEQKPLNQESQQILGAAGQAHFRAQDG